MKNMACGWKTDMLIDILVSLRLDEGWYEKGRANAFSFTRGNLTHNEPYTSQSGQMNVSSSTYARI